MKTEWRFPFDDHALNYLSAKARQINDVARFFGVPAPGLAGGIARERMLNNRQYPWNPFWIAAQPYKAMATSVEWDEAGPAPGSDGSGGPWKPITHATIADYFTRSNTLPREALVNPSYFARLTNPIFFDVGPGNMKIRTAILMLRDVANNSLA